MPDEGESEGKDFGKFCVFLSRSCGVLSSISETTTCTNIVKNCEQSGREECACVCVGVREGMHQGVADLSIHSLHIGIRGCVFLCPLQLSWCVVLSLSFPCHLHWWAAMGSVSQQDLS